MKKFILIILILFCNFLYAGFTGIPFSTTVDEYKTDIYFGNGVWNDTKGAESGRAELDIEIKDKIIKNDLFLQKKYGEVKLSYNWGKGYMEDVLETYYQLRKAGQVNNLEFFALILIVTKGNAPLAAAATASLMAKLPYNADTEQANIDEMLTNYYLESFQWSHRVLLVSHSQGNLFANRIYDSLDPSGYKKYFTNVQVGSPASSIYTPEGKYITNRGDLIINPIPGSMPGNVNPDSENIVLPSCLDAVMHLDYNKSKEVCSSIVDNHQFVPFYLGQSDPLSQIIPAIRYQLEALKWRPSQWKPKNLGCICKDKNAKVTHLFDDEANELMVDQKVKDFKEDEDGKIYQVKGKYVRALEGGVTIEEIEEGEICYELNDEEFFPLGTIKGGNEEPIPKNGIITVNLTWEDSEINMSLKVGMPFGEQDIKDIGCPLEHFYVASEEDISPGTYPVYVRNSDGADESLIPQNVHLTIHTPGEAMTFNFDITASDMLDIGHVANIIITADKKVHFEYTSSGSGNLSGVAHYVSSYNDEDEDDDNNTADYSAFIYSVQSTLKQALLGPLSNAVVELTKAKSSQNNTVLYTGATTGGDSLLTSGLISFPSHVLNTLDNEVYYVVSIIGGDDIDVDDDGDLDTASTPSNGTIRSILSGRQLKNENFKVTILTEAIYQLTKEMLTDELNTTTMVKTLDAITQKLLIADVNEDGMIDYNDALWWLPMFDKAKLLKPYATSYQPIVEKIYRDEEIYDDVYALINDPYFRTQKMQVSEDAQMGTIIGKVYIDLYEGTAAAYTINGDDSSFFEIDDEGIVTLSDDAHLDYETKKKYTLSVTVEIDTEMLSMPLIIDIDDILDSPVLDGFTSYIDENSSGGTSVGKLHVNPGLSSVTEIVLQGKGSEKFTVDLEGNISVAHGAVLDYEIEKSFRIYAVARNSYGHSLAAEITVILQDLPEVPVVQEFNARVQESAQAGTVVGTLLVIENGSAVTSIELSGTGYEDFNIETNGTITLSSTAQLDYSSCASYVLQAQAANVIGVSDPVRVTINVTNIIDAEPVLNDTILNIEENATIGTVIGMVKVNSTGVSAIEYMTLSGVGTQQFSIYVNGIVKLIGVLDYESKKVYDLNVTATNQFGTSDTVPLKIIINNISEYPPVLYDMNITVKSGISVDSVIGNVLKETGDTPIDEFIISEFTDIFGIHVNGDIYLKEPLYENNQTSYTFSTYAKTSLSESNSVTINIVVVSGIINTIDTPHSANDMVLSSDGTKAFVADGKSGLQIIDVSNMMEAQIIGSVDTPDYAMNVVLSLDGTKAYIADGYSGLQIIDISDASAPEIISSINTLGYAHSITLSIDGTKVLIADGYAGLQMVDVSDPTIPETIGSLNTLDYAQSIILSIDGTKAYIADGSSGLQIVDVSNPAIPVIISSLDTPGYARDIVLSTDGTKVFIADGGSGLQVVDINNFTVPVIISSMDTSAYDISLSTDGTKVFLIGYSNLQIVDISDITAPNVVTSLDIRYANAVVLSNDDSKVYVTSSSIGLRVVDIRQIELEDKVPGLYSPPLSVDEETAIGSVVGQMMITYQGSSGITSIQLQGDGSEDFTIDLDGLIRLINPLNYATKNQYNLKVLATNSVGIREVDVMIRVHTIPEISDFSTTVNSMSKAGTLVGKLDMWVDNETTLSSIILSGEGSENFTINTKGEIYVAPDITLHHFITLEYNLSVIATNAYGRGEAKVHINVSAIVISMEDLVEMKDVVFSSDGTKAYMLSNKMGLQIIDISDIKSPKIIQTVDLPDYVESMVLSKDENKVFVANGDSGLQIVDISDLKRPTIIGSVSDLTYAYDIVLSSDDMKAFIVDVSSGLKVIDISDPTAAQIIGSVDTGGKVDKVVLSMDNSKAFVGNNDYPDYKLQVMDVIDPREPVLIASLDTSGEIRSMVISPNGRELFVANWSLGLQIIDINDPEIPTIINTIETDGSFNKFTLSPDGTKIMALDNSTLQVIDIQELMNPIGLGTVDNIYYSEGIDISSDGTQVIVADWWNGVYVIDLIGLE